MLKSTKRVFKTHARNLTRLQDILDIVGFTSYKSPYEASCFIYLRDNSIMVINFSYCQHGSLCSVFWKSAAN